MTSYKEYEKNQNKNNYNSKDELRKKLLKIDDETLKNDINISIISEKDEYNCYEDNGNNDSVSLDGFVIVSTSNNNFKYIKEKKEHIISEQEIDIDEFNEEIEKMAKKRKKTLEKLRLFLMSIEILLGCSLAFASIFLFCISFDCSSSFQRILSSFIEIIILIVSFMSVYPKKNNTFRKSLSVLYIWIILFLIPLSFFTETGIKNEEMQNHYHQMLIYRLYILILQLLLFFISFITKIEI